MKRVIYFIGLKIAEISGVFLIYYLLCLLAMEVFSEGYCPFWISGAMLGMLIFVIVGLTIFLSCVLCAIIKKNWEWSKKLSQK